MKKVMSYLLSTFLLLGCAHFVSHQSWAVDEAKPEQPVKAKKTKKLRVPEKARDTKNRSDDPVAKTPEEAGEPLPEHLRDKMQSTFPMN